MKQKLDKIKILVWSILLLPSLALAQTTIRNPLANIKTPKGDSVDTFFEFTDFIIGFISGLIAFTAMIAIIVSGYQMVFSGGNEEKIKIAKQRMLWAVMGVVVVLLAYSIVQILLRIITNPKT